MAGATLGFLGLQAALVLPLFPPAGALGAADDPDLGHLPGAPLIGAGMGVVAGAFVAAYGALCLAGAWGIRRQDPLGFALAVVAFGFLLTGCPMIAAHGLFALLREPARRRFGVS